MESLSVILMVLLAFSGSGLWLLFIILAARRREAAFRAGMVLYSCAFLHVLASSSLLAAYQIKDLIVLMAEHPVAAETFLDIAVGLRIVARCASLIVLARLIGADKPRRARLALGLAPLALSLLYAAYYAAGLPFLGARLWEDALAFALAAALWAYGFAYLRLASAPGRLAQESRLAARVGVFVFLPAKAALIALDAFMPGGIDPLAFALPELLFFLFLNLRAYRLVARMAADGSGRRMEAPGGGAALESLGLSIRELEVARLLADGKPYKEIARRLSISLDTVKSHAKAVYRKSSSPGRSDLMRRFRSPAE